MTDNHFFIVNTFEEIEDDPLWDKVKELLNDNYEIKRCYSNDKAFIFHIVEHEEEDIVEEHVVESVIEVALSEDPTTVKAYTDQGWVVRDYYSKRVQLIKHREVEEVEKDE